MANISTITYNGSILAETEETGNVAVIYDGETIADIGAGETKTFACADKIMKTNLYIGAKTLLCEMSKMISDVIVAVRSAFPSEPSAYNLIGTYTSSQTWNAPEDGYFQIEVFGASGNSGKSLSYSFTDAGRYATGSGGGGGGGAFSASRVKLNEGDSVILTVGGVGSSCSVSFQSSLETYSSITVTSGRNGSNASGEYSFVGGNGGSAGTASGGNHFNRNGSAGGNGSATKTSTPAAVGVGGASAVSGGNAGASSPSPSSFTGGTKTFSANPGKAGFIKIYRGDTNVVA